MTPWAALNVLNEVALNLSCPAVSHMDNFISLPLSKINFVSNFSWPIVARLSLANSMPMNELHIAVFPTVESPNKPILMALIFQ